jgi:hypothetical protein
MQMTDLPETTTPTIREQRVALGEMPNETWDVWCAELVRLGGDRYGPRGVIVECGADCWRGYYDDGYGPDDALAEDASYADS